MDQLQRHLAVFRQAGMLSMFQKVYPIHQPHDPLEADDRHTPGCVRHGCSLGSVPLMPAPSNPPPWSRVRGTMPRRSLLILFLAISSIGLLLSCDDSETRPSLNNIVPPPLAGIVCTDRNKEPIVCTYPEGNDPEVVITIEGYRSDGREKEVMPREIAQWLITAQAGLKSMALGFDKRITARFDEETKNWGRYKQGVPEQRHMIFLKQGTYASPHELDSLRATVLHEYFHHAQEHPGTVFRSYAMLGHYRGIDPDLPKDPEKAHEPHLRKWLTEGTAEWFAIEMLRVLSEKYPAEEQDVEPIMEFGVNASGRPQAGVYYDWSNFFTLVNSACVDFPLHLKDMLSTNDILGDRTGIKTFNKALGGASCDFGDHLGSSESGSLAAAVTYYNYATMHYAFIKNKGGNTDPLGGRVSLLDPDGTDCILNDNDAPDKGACFKPTGLKFVPEFSTSTDDWASQEIAASLYKKSPTSTVFTIPPTGAYSFSMPETTGDLPDGKEPELTIRAKGRLIISIAGDEATTSEGYLAGSNSTYECCPGSDHMTHGYGTSNAPVPRLFVTLYNPDFENEVTEVSVSFAVKDSSEGTSTLTSQPGRRTANGLQPGDACLSGDSDNLVWRKRVWKDPSESSWLVDPLPAVSEGIAYIGTDENSLLAVDAKTGDSIWEASIGDHYVAAAAAISEGSVFIGLFGDVPHTNTHRSGGLSDRQSHLYALNARTGKTIWKQQLFNSFGQGTDGIESSPVADDGGVYVGAHNGYLYAYEAETGNLLWQFIQHFIVTSPPTVGAGRVYFKPANTLYALDAQTGSLLWERKIESRDGISRSAPIMAGNSVLVSGTDRNVYALATDTGEQIWRFETPSGKFGDLVSSPAVDGDVVYVGTGEGLVALDANSGELKWHTELNRLSSRPHDHFSYQSPTVVNGVVYIGGEVGPLYAVDAETGEMRWCYDVGARWGRSLAVSDGVLYAWAADGYLYALSTGGAP